MCIWLVQVNLKEQGQLIRQDEFLVSFRKKKYYRHIFLFQDLILFSKTKKTEVGNDIYIYKQSFKVITLYIYIVHPRIDVFISLNCCCTLKQNTKICANATFHSFSLFILFFFLHSLYRPLTLGWHITVVIVGCALKFGFEGGSHRTHTHYRQEDMKWRKTGPKTWRGFCGSRRYTTGVSRKDFSNFDKMSQKYTNSLKVQILV